MRVPILNCLFLPRARLLVVILNACIATSEDSALSLLWNVTLNPVPHCIIREVDSEVMLAAVLDFCDKNAQRQRMKYVYQEFFLELSAMICYIIFFAIIVCFPFSNYCMCGFFYVLKSTCHGLSMTSQ